MMQRPFQIIAHRGASASAPENTLSAFRSAISQGAQQIELDVRLSADEQVVVFHDDQLDQKTHLRGRVRHYDAEILEQVDLLPWFKKKTELPRADSVISSLDTCIPRLERVFQQLGNQVYYHIELKGWDDRLPLLVLRAVDAFKLQGRVTLTSFSKKPLTEIRKLSSEVPITFLLRDAADAITSREFRPELDGLSLSEIHEYWLRVASEAQFQWVGIRARDITEETIQVARSLGLEVRGWGVKNVGDVGKLIHLGTIGATVDWPGKALDFIKGF